MKHSAIFVRIRCPYFCLASCSLAIAILGMGCNKASSPASAATKPSESESQQVDSGTDRSSGQPAAVTASAPESGPQPAALNSAEVQPAVPDSQASGGETGAGESVAQAKPVEYWPQRDILEITFNDLKFDIEKGGDFEDSMLTDKIRQLDGRKVRIRGFMLSSAFKTGLKGFVLLQNDTCPYGGPEALVYHNVMIELTPGQTTEYTIRPLTVEGTFAIRPFPDDGSFRELSVYYMGNATVEAD